MPRPPLQLFRLVLIGLLTWPGVASAQQARTDWAGHWRAEGTLFEVQVSVSEDSISVSAVESLGFQWRSEAGKIVGSTARIPVQYAGVAGVVQVELLTPDIAVARAASCTPEYMVVCALASQSEAVFRRVEDDQSAAAAR